jgi:hypothetical protein
MKSNNKNLLIVLVVVIVFGFAGITVWNSAQSKNLERVFVENKTRSLKVESIKESGEISDSSIFEITFKNNYDKPISVYRFRVSDELTDKNNTSAVEKGGLTDGWILRPNEISVTKFSARSKGKIILTIAAVLFEDGAGDGETNDLTRLQQIRAGVLVAFQKIVPVLREAKKDEESLSSAATIQTLEDNIKLIDDEDSTLNTKRGFALVKDYVIYELKEIREKTGLNSDSKTKVIRKIAEFELQLTKLSEELPSSIRQERRRNEN